MDAIAIVIWTRVTDHDIPRSPNWIYPITIDVQVACVVIDGVWVWIINIDAALVVQVACVIYDWIA